MRIIAGKYKSRVIQRPKGAEVRPTQDRVREAVFNILGGLCEGARVLDLYSGSGAFGIEALSRGAEEVFFVDNTGICISTIKKNLKALSISDNIYLVRSDAIKAIKRYGLTKERFNLIFLDPPYSKGLVEKTLIALDGCDIIRPSGFVVAEHRKNDKAPESTGSLGLIRRSIYGDTAISFYKSK